MQPKIVSLEFTNPPLEYSQREIFDAMNYNRHYWRLFEDSKIDTRYFCVPLDVIKTLSFQEQQELYSEWAFGLSQMAMEKALTPAQMQKIGLLSFSSCTGISPGPTIGHFLADRFQLKDIEITNLAGLGCAGAFPGLRECFNYTKVTGKPSVAITCELSSLSYIPEDPCPDPENDFEVMRSASIFGDGCSCAVIGYDDNPRHPKILDFASVLDTSQMGKLGYVWRNGRLRVRLDREVPKIAVRLASQSVAKLLKQNNLEIPDINYWIIHPPGSIVLDNLRDTLHIPEEKLKYSREVLRKFGNCSSATVGIVGAILMRSEPNPNGYAIMVNVGPGMASHSVLLSWK